MNWTQEAPVWVIACTLAQALLEHLFPLRMTEREAIELHFPRGWREKS